MLKGTKITHGWGGSLAISRKFAPYVYYDKGLGLATAGGYGGQGVGASHLFARTLADLILNQESDLIDKPWVISQAFNKQYPRRWEPEPFRWLTSKLLISYFSWEEKLYLNENIPQWQRNTAFKIGEIFAKVVT